MIRLDPAFDSPSKPIGPLCAAQESEGLAAEEGSAFQPDRDSGVVPAGRYAHGCADRGTPYQNAIETATDATLHAGQLAAE